MKNVSMFRMAVLASALVGTVASADPIFVSVGQTKYLNLSRHVKRAAAEDGSLLTVKRQSGRTVALTGMVPGKTEVRLSVEGGEQIITEVHVVAEGSTVYAAGRESNQFRARVVADSAAPVAKPAIAKVPVTSPSSSASAGL
jgi:Pilus formation protein N terminal region